MPLKIIIIGAGVAGLTAAIALKNGGHEVQIFEQSPLAAEYGAAVPVAANGARVLSHLGFSFQKAKAVLLPIWEVVDAVTLRQIITIDQRHSLERWGHPMRSLHRVDLLQELLRLAKSGGRSDILRLSSKVMSLDAHAGRITLQDGSVHEADLIVGADGLHSFVRSTVVEEDDEPTASDRSAFRFLIPTEKMENDPRLRKLLRRKSLGSSVLVDTDSHLAWFACRGGEIQNLAGVASFRKPSRDFYGTQGEYRSELLHKFEHIHPEMKGIVEAAEHVKFWPLFQREPLKTWTYGKVLLIGDAAHPMLPFGCQGSNQALEDAGALGHLLQGITATQLPRRLQVFEQLRVKRAARVQILSSVRAGEEAEVVEQLYPWIEPGVSIPRTFLEKAEHNCSFDVYAKCNELLRNRRSIVHPSWPSWLSLPSRKSFGSHSSETGEVAWKEFQLVGVLPRIHAAEES